MEIPVISQDSSNNLGLRKPLPSFIQAHSRIVIPAMANDKKGTTFTWSSKTEEASQSLKTGFTTVPVLMDLDREKPIVVETNASDYVSAGVMSQCDDREILHTVPIFSKKYSPAECNNETYDKELLTVIRSFEEWG